MKFSINIVLGVLQKFRGKPHIDVNDNRKYSWAALIPDMIDEMDEETIYICRLTQALNLNHQEKEFHFVCIADRYLSDDELDDEDFLKNIILIEENRSISWLLSLIQNRFRELERWENEMKECVLSGGNYQDLFDISEKYLKNSLFALDGAYRLIANSKTYMSSDPMNISLYEKGYYTPDILEKFYKNKRFSEYSSTPGVTVNKAGVIAQFESFGQWCRYGGVELIQIVEVFSHSPVGPDSMELFVLLMKYINQCFIKEQEEISFSEFSYTRLLRDMLSNSITDINQINEAAKKIGIPINGNFNVYKIKFNDINKVLMGRFIMELTELIPDTRVIAVNNCVCALNYYKKGNVKDVSAASIQKLIPLLERHDAICGISPEFRIFNDLENAYRQAEYVLNLYGRHPQLFNSVDNSKARVFYYQNVILLHLIETGSMVQYDVFHNNPYLRMLEKLLEYDSKNGTCLYELLFVYLYNERKASDTASILHMHRNTVMYHLQHINDMLEVNLDDYNTRQGFLLAYHFKELKNS